MNVSFLHQIKANCDISDAKYWGYFSICGLLMRYRDLFRSEQGLAPWAEFGRETIAAWIERKESRWPELEQQDFTDITVEGRAYHPFAVAAVNEALQGAGLVYGAGYGMYLKPTFFLAELQSVREVDGRTVYTAGRELARDLFTSPAMLQGQCIFLRREPLTALLWEKFSELGAGRGFALDDAFPHYGLRPGQAIDTAFETGIHGMAERYAETLLQHELAESLEGLPEWKDILLRAGERKAEHYLRAVKDLIADTSDHGPFKKIIETRDRGALSLSIGLLEGYRKILFPEIREAYTAFLAGENWELIEAARTAGRERFRTQQDRIVALARTSAGEAFTRNLQALLQSA